MKEKIAIISILANMILAGGKITMGLISNSAAILAAGVDSFVDIFSSGVSYAGIKISNKPEDEKHPYGHYKFEVLAGVIITIILLITGFGILNEAYKSFLNPREVNIGYLAFIVMIFTTIVNEIMSRLKIHYGKKENSVSLLSDGLHSKIDVYTSIIILVGIFLTKYWVYADALLATMMGFYIIKESISIGKDATGSLLDVSADEESEQKIKDVLKKESIEYSSLKTQKKGSAITANMEIKLPKDLNVEEATKISNNLKNKLLEKIEELKYVAIQIESYNIETSFYKPVIGKGFGWQRKGRFKNKDDKKGKIDTEKTEEGKGPEGNCVCPECGYKIKHERGVPCSNTKCPNCEVNLERE